MKSNKLFLLILFQIILTNELLFAAIQDNDSLKINSISLLSQEWGFLTFYTPISDNQPKEWMSFLSESINNLDTTSNIAVTFKSLSDEMILKCKSFLLSSNKRIKNRDSLLLYNKTLFDWINNPEYSISDKAFFNNLMLYPHPPHNGLTPKEFTDPEKQKNEIFKEIFKGELKLISKYNALANAILYWNTLAYFSPYPINKKDKWILVLKKYIPIFLNGNSWMYVYTNNIRNLGLESEDSHINGFSTKWSSFIKVDKINDTVIIRCITKEASLKYDLHVGDIILKKNGKSLDTIFCFGVPYYFRGSHPLVSIRNANNFLLYTEDSILKLQIQNKNGFVKDVNIGYADMKNGELKETLSDSIIITRKINDSIPYINLGYCNRDQLYEYFKQNKDSKYLVLDLRDYPHISIDGKCAKYLITNKDYMELRYIPYFKLPGYFIKYHQYPYYFFKRPLFFSRNINFAKNYMKNKRVFLLANENTQSHGEYVLQYIKSACNGIIVGRNTAGVNSTVSIVKLSQNINIYMSNNLTYDKNGILVSGNGITPNVYVEKDVNIVKQGKDEIIEKVIELIKGK